MLCGMRMDEILIRFSKIMPRERRNRNEWSKIEEENTQKGQITYILWVFSSFFKATKNSYNLCFINRMGVCRLAVLKRI